MRAATVQDAAGIVGIHKAANPYGDWYRNPHQRLARVPYEDLTPFERYLHGGFGMDLSLLRRHVYEFERRGFPVLVAEDAGRIVGEAEVWLDEEPAPFGRYAAVTTLAVGLPPNQEVAGLLLARIAERVRKMGYHALDLVPLGASASVVGPEFHSIWKTATFSADTDVIPKPAGEFTTHFLAGEYGDLRGLLLLNHRQPARWRFESLSGVWPAAVMAGVTDATKVLSVTVRPENGGEFAVLASVPRWREPAAADLDVWMNPAAAAKRKEVETAFSIGVELARKLGTKRVEVPAPPTAGRALRALGFADGGEGGAWLRKPL
ncbi:MAG TPA: hypothetical protein VGR51_06970 [Thermoplasmata archaeon]|nr:hypothetical protein [Thermoplasmata archaeon]